jgi:hypothetical protein
MKLFTGWILTVGLVLAATGAHAQSVAPNEAGRPLYRSVSDVSGPAVGGPYAAMPPEAPRPGYGPTLLPSIEVYTVVREAGLSPLGIPHLRGFIYTIVVIDRSGNDGRLFIDARNGRVIRVASAHGIGNAMGSGIGDNFSEDPAVIYGAPGALPPPTNVRGAPRPPRTIPHVANRTVPVPKASPLASKPVTEPAAKPAPEQAQQQTPAQPETPPPQTAAITPKPAEPQTSPPAAATTGAAQAKPTPQIAPTQDMPKMQGLE